MAVRRIDSLIRFVNSQGTAATGTLVQITRTNLVMEVYNPYSIIQLSEMLGEVILSRDDREIYNGRAVVSSLVNTGLYLIVSVTLVDPWQDLLGLEQDALGIKQEAQLFLDDWEVSHQLMPSFELTVLEIRSMLSELNRWLEQIDLLADQEGTYHSADKAQTVFQEVKDFYHPWLYERFQIFEQQAAEVPQEDVIKHRRFAQRDLHPFIMRSPFIWRTFNKPLGYAGDYEMVNMMLRDFDEGPTSYAKLINSLFLSSGPAAAHRNRIDLLCRRLSEIIITRGREGVVKILNIGCGPALEVQQLIKDGLLDGRCELTLLDFNEETLRYTKQILDRLNEDCVNPVKINYVNKSVHTMLKEATRTDNGSNNKYDIVYCAGLFDYLSDKVCARLLRLFKSLTKPEGTTLVTNVHSNNPVKNIMDFLLEWHLIYRDEESMSALYNDKAKKNVYMDKTTINIFMELQ